MILWHFATALFGFRWVFRDPQADLRWLLVGALGPDLVDLLVGTLIWEEVYSSGEIYGHTLSVTMAMGIAVLLFTRRGSEARRNLMVMMVGWLIHLVADGIWMRPQVFWWPFWGWTFPSRDFPFWAGAWDRALSDPWRWIREAVGLAYLLVLSQRSSVGLGRFFRTGRLA